MKPATLHPDRPLLTPGSESKSGCLWCPLLPWSHDFDEFRPSYCRDGDKVLAKEPDGHTVHCRGVSEAWSQVDVLFVGEAPGADEDKAGTPFIGRSGKLLRATIEEVFKGSDAKVGITNLVRCRPPRNRDPNRTEVQSCAPELLREIAARKPRLIVVLGNHSLEFLTGNRGITKFCGKVLDATHPQVQGLQVVGCLHPAYILRFDHELPNFVDAIETARRVLDGEYESKPGAGEVFVLDELQDVVDLLHAFVEDGVETSFDTETGALNWWQEEFPRLLCISFSNEEGVSYVVPFDHAESPWRVGGPKEHERPKLIEALREFFLSALLKLAQNGKFDAKHIQAALGIRPVNVIDTMTTHLVLDERRGTHGLDALAHSYTGMGGYERPLADYVAAHPEANPDRGGSYANIPGHILFPYAGWDADVTRRVYFGLLEEPEYKQNKKLRRLAENFLPALSEVLTELEWNGAQIDRDVVQELDVEYRAEMERVSAEMRELETVRKFAEDKGLEDLNVRSPKQLQEILFSPSYYGSLPVHCTKTGLERLALRYQKQVAEWRPAKAKKQPSFTNVVLDALKNGEFQYFSTDAEALQELDLGGNELASKIVEFRGVATLHGTFIKPLADLLDPDGRVHGTFMEHGTVTGRLASYDPNLQNIPNKGGGRVKHAYVSRFGDEGLICQADYSQIELRIGASIFNEPTMIQAYVDGVDNHMLTALVISKLTLEQYKALPAHEQKDWRTRAKRVNFGILYQGGPAALVKTLKKDGTFITMEEAEEMIRLYYEGRPALRAGIERLQEGVRRRGYLESFTGRRRRVPEVESVDEKLVARALRQAVNFPVQSGASDMTLMSLVLIYREMKARNLRSKIILTVHDSIVFDCHVDEFAEVLQLAKEIMESLPKLSDLVLPGLDWGWLKTPIVADFEVGTRWGTLVEFNPLDFDIDDVWDRMAKKEAA